MRQHRGGRREMVPAYAATTRAEPTRNSLDALTIIRSLGSPPAGLTPAQHRLLTVLEGGALTLVDASRLLRLPLGVVRIVVSELVDQDLILARAPIPQAQGPDTDTLRRVLDGLRQAARDEAGLPR
ncbi:DUF742 domain-containing protein [Streptomyces xiamenensis]|uniref:DUF742 domain-containing protein n=1 Tax=Streptomyces xiamenensis TaxID=408015 RepID=UPI0036E681EF